MSLSATIKAIRLRRGWSQRQLGKRMGVPRTYCSKCETGKTTPTLGSLRRIAAGLEVSVAELLSGTQQRRDDQVRDLISDPFLSQIIPHMSMFE